jgi:hypothetical protein
MFKRNKKGRFIKGFEGYWKGKKQPPRSEEFKKRMSEFAKLRIGPKNNRYGKKLSEDHKQSLRLANLGKKHSEETRKKMSISFTGRKVSNKTRKKISKSHKKIGAPWMKGKKASVETRKKIGDSSRGCKSHFWKGGITPINHKIRTSLDYILWRESVFMRDNFTCQSCGDNKGGNLNAHHIKPFYLYPELRLAIDNGITLCEKCHKKEHTSRNNNR